MSIRQPQWLRTTWLVWILQPCPLLLTRAFVLPTKIRIPHGHFPRDHVQLPGPTPVSVLSLSLSLSLWHFTARIDPIRSIAYFLFSLANKNPTPNPAAKENSWVPTQSNTVRHLHGPRKVQFHVFGTSASVDSWFDCFTRMPCTMPLLSLCDIHLTMQQRKQVGAHCKTRRCDVSFHTFGLVLPHVQTKFANSPSIQKDENSIPYNNIETAYDHEKGPPRVPSNRRFITQSR